MGRASCSWYHPFSDAGTSLCKPPSRLRPVTQPHVLSYLSDRQLRNELYTQRPSLPRTSRQFSGHGSLHLISFTVFIYTNIIIPHKTDLSSGKLPLPTEQSLRTRADKLPVPCRQAAGPVPASCRSRVTLSFAYAHSVCGKARVQFRSHPARGFAHFLRPPPRPLTGRLTAILKKLESSFFYQGTRACFIAVVDEDSNRSLTRL